MSVIRSDLDNVMLTEVINLQQTIANKVYSLFTGTGPYASDYGVSGTLNSNGINLGVGAITNSDIDALVVELYGEDQTFGKNFKVSWVYPRIGDMQAPVAAQVAPYNIFILTSITNALNTLLTSINSNNALPNAAVLTAPVVVVPTTYNYSINLSIQLYGGTGSPIVLPGITGANLNVADTVKILLIPTPSYSVTYQNLNSKVLSIDTFGNIEALSQGYCQIVVGPLTDGSKEYIPINFYVNNPNNFILPN